MEKKCSTKERGAVELSVILLMLGGGSELGKEDTVTLLQPCTISPSM